MTLHKIYISSCPYIGSFAAAHACFLLHCVLNYKKQLQVTQSLDNYKQPLSLLQQTWSLTHCVMQIQICCIYRSLIDFLFQIFSLCVNLYGPNENTSQLIPACSCAHALITLHGLSCLSSDVCSLSVKVGRCKALIPRYFYSSRTKKCHKFYYGGCGGNGNNFGTLSQCQQKCMHSKLA